MHELRLVAVSEDGTYAVLVSPGRGGRYSLPIDDRLRAVARGQFSRLAQYEIEVESPLRPKEIQERIRAGETADEIADAHGVAIERVRWFEGPVLAERAYRAQEALSAMVRRPGDSGPGPRLGEVVTERLGALGSSAEEAQWDSTKRGDGSWQVQLAFSAAGRVRTAEWIYDPRRRHATPVDEGAAMLSLPEADLPPSPGGRRGEATVTPLQPRLHAGPAAGHPSRRATEAPPGKPETAPAAERSQDAGPAAERESRRPAAAREAEPGREAAAAPAEVQTGRRAAGGRGRRASVPSWDEIMFGSSRPRESAGLPLGGRWPAGRRPWPSGKIRAGCAARGRAASGSPVGRVTGASPPFSPVRAA